MLLGAHMSTAGGLETAFERGDALGCTAIQIFTSSPRQWKGRDLTEPEVASFHAARARSACEVVLAHDIYLTRLGTRDETILARSRSTFARELATCQRLGVSLLVLHPVGDRDADADAVLDRVAESLDRVFETVPDEGTRVALETTAGQGADVGYRFEHLARIMERVSAPERLAVCLDTCHVFGAGYDIRSEEGYDLVLAGLDAAVGLDRLAAIHLNDSQKPLGSRVDRHTHIGRGEIGPEAFARIMRDPHFAGVPKVLETPKEDDMDAVNLALLRGWADAG